MIRSFLGVGDRAGQAVVTEGLDTISCSNPPPRVQISTLYMKTWCNACKQEGHIAPTGPRWPGTGPNGQPWALSGDINLCGCTPPPVFFSNRSMRMVFTAEDVARLTGKLVTDVSMGAASSVASAAAYDEQVTASARGVSLRGYPFLIETSDGRTMCARAGANGRLPRIYTDNADTYTIYWGDDALSHEGWRDAE
jgi:hypothetical protein